MNFWKIKLGDAVLPKYTYFYNAFEDIYKRVEMNFPAIYKHYEELPFKIVLLYVCKLETENYPKALDDFTEVHSETMFKDIGECSDIQYFLDHTIRPQTFTLLILSESLKSQLRLKNKNMILINVDGKTNFNLDEQRLSTSSMGTLFSDTDSALEKIITSKVEPMYHVMEDFDVMDPPQKIQRVHARDNGTLKNTDELSRLVAEMGALLDISGDHHAEKKENTDNTEITKELCDSLKAACPSVRRIGYRFGTLEIQAVIAKENEAKIKENIRDALKKFDIFHYQITACLEQIRYFTWIGSKVETGNGFGTFGCILQDVARNEQYGAVSKHVIKIAKKVTLKTDDIDIPGTVVRDTATDGDCSLDIAAIKLEKNADENACKFKDSSGRLLRGKLNNTHIRSGRRVHIYGATSNTNPGRGIISCPEMLDLDMKEKLMQIENVSPDAKFASKGDSGAIVCADDPSRKNVFALGMVMGALNGGEKTYAALPLPEGIHQLSKIMNTDLELM